MSKTYSFVEAITVIAIFLFFVGLAVFLPALILQWAWNFVIAGVFGAPYLSYWAAFALALLLGMVGNYFKSKKD